MTDALRLDRISKSFGGLHVLRDLSITVEVGECVAVIGPNGAGKTTLLNVVTGALDATQGEIHLFGRDVTMKTPFQRAHLGLTRSFQINRLFYDLTVLDNVLLALQGMRRSRFQIFRPAYSFDGLITEARGLLERIDLGDKEGQLVSNIAYGQQRALEVVMSLAANPRLLLLDEPSAGLAVAEIPAFIDTIKAFTKDTTVIFSAHDMDVVFGLAERVLVLYFGEFIADGNPEEVRKDPKVIEIYLGVEEEAEDAQTS